MGPEMTLSSMSLGGAQSPESPPSPQWELGPLELEPQGGSTIHYSSTLPSMIFSLKHVWTVWREEEPLDPQPTATCHRLGRNGP